MDPNILVEKADLDVAKENRSQRQNDRLDDKCFFYSEGNDDL